MKPQIKSKHFGSRGAGDSFADERELTERAPLHFDCIIDGERGNASLRWRWRASRPRSGWQHLLVLLILLVSFNLACVSPSLKANKAVNKLPENKPASFESDLETMKTAKFDYIFVFRRKDGGVLDSEDKAFLKANSPPATNRFILSDDDKAAIAGSGFEFPAENLETLRKRFDIEDFSMPKRESVPKSDK